MKLQTKSERIFFFQRFVVLASMMADFVQLEEVQGFINPRKAVVLVTVMADFVHNCKRDMRLLHGQEERCMYVLRDVVGTAWALFLFLVLSSSVMPRMPLVSSYWCLFFAAFAWHNIRGNDMHA